MATASLTTLADLFKHKYEPLSKVLYNSANKTTSQIKKTNDFTGDQKNIYIELSFGGSVGTGSLPTANVKDVDQAVLTAIKHYARANIDRESTKAASNDTGAFKRLLTFEIQSKVESYMRNDSRMFFGNADGSLGTIAGVTDNGGGNYTLEFAAGYNLANFEEKDYVNIETGNTDLFEIEIVDPQTDGTLDVTVQRITGTQVPVATDVVFMQGSENNDAEGLKSILDATSGSLYGVPVARRWQAEQLDASATTLTTDIMNEISLNIEKKIGKAPNMIATSYRQQQQLLELIEDQKRYELSPRYLPKKLKGTLSFDGLQFMTSMGTIDVIPERFSDDDRMYFLNKDYITRAHRPGGVSWFNDDGSIWLREADSDTYEARYGGYYQNFISPTAHGVITSLAT